MSPANSPIPTSMEKMLQTTMAKLSSIELNIWILVKENEYRIQEIKRLGQAAGLWTNVQTDKEDPRYETEKDK